MITTKDERIIKLSRTKIVFLTVGALGFVALGLWLVLLDDAFIQSFRRFNDPTFVHGSGLAAVLFFGVCAVAGIRKLYDRKPGLVFSREGMLDNASSVAAGFVPWQEITGAEMLKIERTRILVVKVADPQKYVERGGKWKRMLLQTNLKLYGSPIQIPATALQIDFDELVKLFTEYLTKHGNQS